MKKKTKMLVLSAVALLVIAVSVVLIIISNKLSLIHISEPTRPY